MIQGDLILANKSLGPYTVLASREAYANRWIRVREDQVIRPGGTHGSFGIIEMKPGSSVLALTATFDVYLVREFKYGIGRDSIELISGAMEDGETPLDAAKRELLEEVGLLASNWVELGIVDPFTTVVKSPNFMFLALGVTQHEASPDEGETIDVVRVSLAEAVGMVMRNEITHSASCVSILKAERWLRDHPEIMIQT
jgi:ADP-ribose pyrophosphatase